MSDGAHTHAEYTHIQTHTHTRAHTHAHRQTQHTVSDDPGGGLKRTRNLAGCSHPNHSGTESSPKAQERRSWHLEGKARAHIAETSTPTPKTSPATTGCAPGSASHLPCQSSPQGPGGPDIQQHTAQTGRWAGPIDGAAPRPCSCIKAHTHTHVQHIWSAHARQLWGCAHGPRRQHTSCVSTPTPIHVHLCHDLRYPFIRGCAVYSLPQTSQQQHLRERGRGMRTHLFSGS